MSFPGGDGSFAVAEDTVDSRGRARRQRIKFGKRLRGLGDAAGEFSDIENARDPRGDRYASSTGAVTAIERVCASCTRTRGPSNRNSTKSDAEGANPP